MSENPQNLDNVSFYKMLALLNTTPQRTCKELISSDFWKQGIDLAYYGKQNRSFSMWY